MSDAVNLQPFHSHLLKFVQLTEDDFEKVMTYFSVVKSKKGNDLITPGQKVNKTYWVLEGLLASYYTDNQGKEHIIQFASESCWIADQQGFYQQQAAIFNTVCLEDVIILSITFDDREKLCTDIPAMGHFFRRKANDSFVKQQQRLLTYLSNDATERFYTFLKEYPDVINRVSKKELASYLGVTRETLSRLKK